MVNVSVSEPLRPTVQTTSQTSPSVSVSTAPSIQATVAGEEAISVTLAIQPAPSVTVTAPSNLSISIDTATNNQVTVSEQGAAGIGIPAGGATNDILTKTANGDYVTAWTDAPTLDSITFDQTAGESPSIGSLSWNSTDGTLNLGLDGGNVVLQLGQEQVVRIRNNTGATITNGQVVYVTGALGQRPTVALASSNAEITSSKTFGVATEDIPNNSQGFIATSGLVRGINTNAFSEGDALYLGSTAGTFTNQKPNSPEHLVAIGWVIKKAGVDDGSIFVHVQNGFELEEIHNVLISTARDGDKVEYDGVANLWKNTKPDKSPSFTYTNGDLTRIDYASGNYKTFTYTAGVLTTVVYTLAGRTVTKTFAYNPDGTLASVTQSEVYN